MSNTTKHISEIPLCGGNPVPGCEAGYARPGFAFRVEPGIGEAVSISSGAQCNRVNNVPLRMSVTPPFTRNETMSSVTVSAMEANGSPSAGKTQLHTRQLIAWGILYNDRVTINMATNAEGETRTLRISDGLIASLRGLPEHHKKVLSSIVACTKNGESVAPLLAPDDLTKIMLAAPVASDSGKSSTQSRR